MIIQTVNRSQFVDAFHRCGRGQQFSVAALFELFEYLDQMSDDCGKPIELDPIAICCDWCEYDSLRKAADEHDTDQATQAFDDDQLLEWFSEQTLVIQVDGGSVLVANH
jgi:hypothetical protein